MRLDIATGQLEVDTSDDKFDSVLQKIAQIIPSLKEAHDANAQRSNAEFRPEASKEEAASEGVTQRKKKAKPARPSDASARPVMGAGKYEDFQPIKLGLSDEAEVGLREFYTQKKPKTQEEQVAVIMFKLGQLLGRDRFNYDQIYQGFRIAGENHPPRSLAGVATNMATKMLIEREADGLRLKIQGLDLVEKQLPQAAPKA